MLSGSTALTTPVHGASTIPRRPRRFTHQFRQEVLAEVRAGTSVSQVARCHNLSAHLVHRWRRKYTVRRPSTRFVPYPRPLVDAVLAGVRDGMSYEAAARKHHVSSGSVSRWHKAAQALLSAARLSSSHPISTEAEGSSNSLEQQLQALLEQYRTLHVRIERIRQLVVAA